MHRNWELPTGTENCLKPHHFLDHVQDTLLQPGLHKQQHVGHQLELQTHNIPLGKGVEQE